MSSVVWRITRPAVALSLLLLAVFTASCGKKEAAEESSSAPPASQQPAPAPAPSLTDANIAAIVVAANTIDIKNAQAAKAKTKNAAVKAFADQMIIDHTSVNKKATDLVTKLKVTPEENDTSRGLVTSADATRDGIKTRTGSEFDKAYIDNEVAYHQAVIDMLDSTLIPGASNAELKALLVSVKPAFAAHLDHAKHVQAALAK